MKLLILFQVLLLSAYVFAQVKSATLDISSCYSNALLGTMYSLRTELWVSNGYHDVMEFLVTGFGATKKACSKDKIYCISGWNDFQNPTSIQMTMDGITKELTVTNRNINRGKICGYPVFNGNTQQYFFEMW